LLGRAKHLIDKGLIFSPEYGLGRLDGSPRPSLVDRLSGEVGLSYDFSGYEAQISGIEGSGWLSNRDL
jgi:hypothetical protein